MQRIGYGSLAALAMANFTSSMDRMIDLFPIRSGKGDFRRQALRPSKWREYRDLNIEKNRASLEAMGLSSNVFEWPLNQQPEWVVARIERAVGQMLTRKLNQIHPHKNQFTAQKIDGLIPVTKHG